MSDADAHVAFSHPSYAFFGSGSFAACCLDLLSAWKKPSWIVTGASKPAGRGNKILKTPVGVLAAEDARFSAVPTLETANASHDEAVLSMRRRETVDFLFVIDFGQKIEEPLLSWGAPIGCLNIHPSLLPRYRGAAPVQRALMDGCAQTGVSIFKLAPAMDAGPILLQTEMLIDERENAAALLERAAEVGVARFVELATTVPMAEWRLTPQDDALATNAPKIARDEERIDWRIGARATRGKIRALAPQPGAWSTIRGRRIRILEAELAECETFSADSTEPGRLAAMEKYPIVMTGDGALKLIAVQPEGKKIQNAAEWWNGLRAAQEECLL